MNLEKLEQVIQLMKNNDVSHLKYHDDKSEIEIDFGSSNPVDTSKDVRETSNQPASSESIDEKETIDAEILGTFYLQDEEELSTPLVKEGDQVKQGQIVGYIESMKVLNEVLSDQDGIIEKLHLNHGDPVEYGQTIITLK